MYDIDMDEKSARKAIKNLFYQHANVKDTNVRDMLVEKGYMELEEAIMYYKQPTHLRELLSMGTGEKFSGTTRKRIGPNSDLDEQSRRFL